MSDSVETVEVTDDLDAFSNEFFGTTPASEEVAEEHNEEEADEVNPSPTDGEEEPETGDEDDALDEDEQIEDDEEDDASLFKVKGKKSARERINELTAKARQAERDLAEVRRLLEERDSKQEVEKPQAQSKPAPMAADAPDPDAESEDGTPKYPLGEFDPMYIRDLTKFTIAQEREADKAARAEEAEREQLQEAEQELVSHWTSKVGEAMEELPDLETKVGSLEQHFLTMDPDYGKYIAATIMSMDYGPHVLDYLADHLDEAQRIADSGPTQATLALARIEARIAVRKEQGNKVDKIVRPTSAPTPPPRNKGMAGKTRVAPDTDDLEAFERSFFSKR